MKSMRGISVSRETYAKDITIVEDVVDVAVRELVVWFFGALWGTEGGSVVEIGCHD